MKTLVATHHKMPEDKPDAGRMPQHYTAPAAAGRIADVIGRVKHTEKKQIQMRNPPER